MSASDRLDSVQIAVNVPERHKMHKIINIKINQWVTLLLYSLFMNKK
ncbi:hypothetical protein GTPT_2417 [Tatumella ptyseos ATCC 33301]|uniref:Uncharacterized protein n=1 Tax=Tatumella ptyseos ATCC 33301 TaxID=1005995 RepID=A0A085JDW0_9GAMM|nr:hypothetical protein GTPT_2417 [Tatumella ptyseos ATCC 33301]